jgi:ABC-type amino acid transport substrate-binding protein
MDWEMAQDMLLSGEADALLQINSSPERERIYDFTDELLKSEFAIFIKTGSNISNVYDLKGKTVGVEKGGYPYYILLKYYGIKINIIHDWLTGLKKLYNDS